MNTFVYPQSQSIWQTIQSASHILLHCHPGPDEDSIGGALATYNLLKSLNKTVTIIQGDSPLPQGFKFLPNADQILARNFTELDLTEFDLFISQDSSSTNMITKLGEVVFPSNLRVIVIDHHVSNTNYGDINLVDSQAPAVCEVLYNLFSSWSVTISPEVAVCLYIGIYGDTGGFKYPGTTPHTLKIASELANINPNFPKQIFQIENNNQPQKLYFLGLALSSIKTYFDNQVAIISVSNKQLTELNITSEQTDKSGLANLLISIPDWQLGITIIESSPQVVNISLRTRDSAKFNLSILAKSLGGGGHQAAAGATIRTTLPEAEKLVIEQISRIYQEFK